MMRSFISVFRPQRAPTAVSPQNQALEEESMFSANAEVAEEQPLSYFATSQAMPFNRSEHQSMGKLKQRFQNMPNPAIDNPVIHQLSSPYSTLSPVVLATKNDIKYSLTADEINRPHPDQLYQRYAQLYNTLKTKFQIAEDSRPPVNEHSHQRITNQRILRFCQLGMELTKDKLHSNFNYAQWTEYMSFALRTITGKHHKKINEFTFRPEIIKPASKENSPFNRYLLATFQENIMFPDGPIGAYGASGYYDALGGREYEQFNTQHGNCGEISKDLTSRIQQLQLPEINVQQVSLEDADHKVVLLINNKIDLKHLNDRITFQELKHMGESNFYIVDLWIGLINPQLLKLSPEQLRQHGKCGFMGTISEFETLLTPNLSIISPKKNTTDLALTFY